VRSYRETATREGSWKAVAAMCYRPTSRMDALLRQTAASSTAVKAPLAAKAHSQTGILVSVRPYTGPHVPAGWKSSIGLPEGSSSRIC
jgi:hypothetical protein